MPSAVKPRIENLTFNNAKIKWRNFAGEEKQFNPKGKRNFVIELDDLEQYEALKELGWEPKLQKPREDDPDFVPKPFLPVTVHYSEKARPPRAFMVRGNTKVALTEDTIFALDFADIESVDLIIRAFQWEFNGREGVKAYLVSIYVNVRQDELEQRYASIPEVDMNGNEILAITSEADYQNPFEDLGERNQREIESGY